MVITNDSETDITPQISASIITKKMQLQVDRTAHRKILKFCIYILYRVPRGVKYMRLPRKNGKKYHWGKVHLNLGLSTAQLSNLET